MQRHLMVLIGAAAIFMLAVFDTGPVQPPGASGEVKLATNHCKQGYRFDWAKKGCVKL